MKTKFSFLLIMLLLNGCSGSPSQGSNYAFLLNSPSTSAVHYVFESFLPPVVYGVYQLNSSFSLFTTFNDSVKVTSYSDSNCTVSSGIVTADSNPVTVQSGLATFSNFSFSWNPYLYQEGLIYLKGTLVSSGLSYCSVALPMINHFNVGSGYIHSGTVGAAGANTAASVNDRGISHQLTNGRYIIGGTSTNLGGGQEATLWRYLPNGNLDTVFGPGHLGYVHFGTTGAAGATGASEQDSVNDVQVDASGKYVLAGSSKNSSNGVQLALWRYASDGTLDTSFGTGGSLLGNTTGVEGDLTAATVQDSGNSVNINSNGLIAVTGTSLNSSGGSDLFIRRYHADGSIDNTFGTSGLFKVNAGMETDIAYSMKIDSNSNYILTGSSQTAAGTKLILWRVTSTGVLDSTFGSGGKVVYSATGAAGASGVQEEDIGRALLIDSNGNYVVAGSSKNNNGGGAGVELTIWRYIPTGFLDSNFNSGGYSHFGTTGAAGAVGALENDVGLAIAQTSGNNYIITGKSVNGSGSHGTEMALWRFTSTGSLDPGFNATGYLHFGSTGAAGATTTHLLDQPSSIQVDSAGTYTIVGSSENNSNGTELAIWRYLSSGILDL